VDIVDNEEEIIAQLCQIIEEKARRAIAERNIFIVGLSGGSICNYLCRGLPKIKSEWSKWKLIFCDERAVPFDDFDSTFRVFKDNLCVTLPIAAEQFVVIKPELSTEEQAKDYENQMRQIFPGEGFPKVDVLLLGVGPDGHTCSLFPGHALLNEKNKWVAAIEDSPKPPLCRITLTYPVLNNARCGLYPLPGTRKAEIVKRLLKDKDDLPANRVKPDELVWILDRASASLL